MSPSVVLSHGVQNKPEGPILNYGNALALQKWRASWEELTTMPSKYTAESMDQAQREIFMNAVLRDGIVQNYSGVRIGLDKSRFRIKNTTVWNIVFEGDFLGQAATFPSWEDL